MNYPKKLHYHRQKGILFYHVEYILQVALLGYQDHSVFAPMLHSLALDSNKKVTNRISTGVLPKNLNHLILAFHQSCLI